MLASQYGYIDIVSLLVVAGANVNAVSKVSASRMCIVLLKLFIQDSVCHLSFFVLSPLQYTTNYGTYIIICHHMHWMSII